jgi:hypothetical protein
MSTKAIIQYPANGTVLFADNLTIHYKLTSYSDPNVSGVRFIVDGVEYTDSNLLGTLEVNNLIEGNHLITGYLLNRLNKKIPNTDFDVKFTTYTNTTDVENKLTYVLKSTIPDFVKEDYPNFVIFIKAYYEWLYSSNNPFYAPLISEDFKDIDKTPEFFVKYFRQQYLTDFPESLTLDKQTGTPLNIKTLIKNIVDFYSSKGTEKSIKFLLKILYDTYSEIYYPKRDIFKASNSKWNQKQSIKFVYSDDRIHEIKAKKMYQDSGETILSSALINEIQVYRGLDNKKIVEVFYSNVDGTFNFEKKFKVNIEDTETIYLTPTVIVNEIVINDGGLNYKVNDKITIKRLTITAGLVEDIAYARVAEVNEFGAIIKVEFVNFGVSYVPKEIDSDGVIVESNNFLYYPIIDTDIGSEAYLDVGTGFIANYDGFWTNKNSHPDGIKKIADNKRFQEFSYVVRTDRMLDRYVDALKKLAHPAGIEVLGDVLIQKTLVEPTIIQDAFIGVYTPLIGNYAAYRIFTDVNVRNAIGYDYIIERELDMNSGSTDAGDFLTTYGAESGVGDVSAIIDTSNPSFISITTQAVRNNRGGIRNEVGPQDTTPASAPSEIFLTNIDAAVLQADVEITSFDNTNWHRNNCVFGFYRIHRGSDGTIDVCEKSTIESLIGFRPNLNGKWRISIFIEDIQDYFINGNTETFWPAQGGCPQGRWDQELFYLDTEFPINQNTNLKVIVYSGTKAEFYINDIMITQVNASDLFFPNSQTTPNSLVSEHYSPPYLSSDPKYFEGPQPLFAGIELRQKIVTSTMSAKVYSMNYQQLQSNTNSQVTDLFPNGFDPEEIIPPQDGVNDFEHQTTTPISQYVSSTKFKNLPDVSDINEKNNYWVVYPHPNTEINNTTDTTAFMDIKLIDFLKQER